MNRVKSLFGIVLMAAMVFALNPVSAQTDKEIAKEKKAQEKKIESDLYGKKEKEVKKQAKELEKDGWKSMGLPIINQLDKQNKKLIEENEDGTPRWIATNVSATGNSFSSAQMKATNLAKVRIAGLCESSIASLVDEQMANNETAEGVIDVNKVVENSKIFVSQKLTNVVKTLEIYRQEGKVYEVQVGYAVDSKALGKIAEEAAQEELQKELDANKAQLEKMMGM